MACGLDDLNNDLNKTGRNICQDLPLSQDPVFKYIVEINLMDAWLTVEEDGEPAIVSYHQIVNRPFYVKTWGARRTITACVDSVVNFSGHEVS